MNYENSPAFMELEDKFASTIKGRLIGRRLRKRLLKIAIEVAPVGYRGADVGDVFKDRISAKVYDEFGNPLLIMILIPVITELVKMLIKWWLERQNEEIMRVWQNASQG